jgi:hypothetical protein
VTDQGRLTMRSGGQALLDLDVAAMRLAHDQALPRRLAASTQGGDLKA